MTGEVLGLPGEILGERYQVLRQLGKKAGRQTLLARDQETQQLVVVKLLTFGNEFSWEDLRLFERETETLKTLKHPAIPCYLDSFEWDTPDSKGFALVQNYIQAQSLEEYLSAGRVFSENEVKQLANALLEILTYLHSQSHPLFIEISSPVIFCLSERSIYRKINSLRLRLLIQMRPPSYT